MILVTRIITSKMYSPLIGINTQFTFPYRANSMGMGVPFNAQIKETYKADLQIYYIKMII